MQTKVSMVVPCYNKVSYIDEMLQSVYDQLYDNIELILVNDGSTDGTRESIAKWELKLKSRGFSVIIIDQENLGVGVAVKRGLSQISGEYVCFPDCDDILHPQYVSKMANALDKDITVDWVIVNVIGEQSRMTSDILRDSLLLLFGRWAVWTKMVRVTYLQHCRVLQNFIESRTSQEPQINIPLALGGSVPVMIDETLYDYRIADGSISGNTRIAASEYYTFFKSYEQLEISVLEKYNFADDCNILLAEIGILRVLYFGYGDAGKTLWTDQAHASLGVNLKTKILQYVSKFERKFETFLKKFSEDTFGLMPNDLNVNIICFIFEIKMRNVSIEKPDHLIKIVENAENIVVCAALSKTTQSFLPIILNLGVKPSHYWDSSADEHNKILISGIVVTKPAYKQLKPRDAVIILALKPEVSSAIAAEAKQGQLLDLSDIKQYLSWAIFHQNRGV